jgi:hypothetical protein
VGAAHEEAPLGSLRWCYGCEDGVQCICYNPEEGVEQPFGRFFGWVHGSVQGCWVSQQYLGRRIEHPCPFKLGCDLGAHVPMRTHAHLGNSSARLVGPRRSVTQHGTWIEGHILQPLVFNHSAYGIWKENIPRD